MATTTAPPETDVDDLQAARDRLDDLHRRIGNGDGKITAKMLGDAENAVRLAELRTKAAEDEAARKAAEKRQAEIDGLVAKLADLQSGPPNDKITEAVNDAVRALDVLFAACSRAHEATVETAAELRRVTRNEDAALPETVKFGHGSIRNRIRYQSRPVAPESPVVLTLAAMKHLARRWDVKPPAEVSSQLSLAANAKFAAGGIGSTLSRYVSDELAALLLEEGRADD